jgi:hypothetical protein
MSEPSAADSLDRLIEPQIKNDRFYRAISEVASTPGVRQILEIGSSSGGGSTEAFVIGALRNPVRPTLHCMEVSVERFQALAARWKSYDFVKCYNLSSVPLEKFPSEEEVMRFWRDVRSKLGHNRLEKVLGWLRADIAYLRSHDVSNEGIREIKRRNGIETFDAVLIDGSEFTGIPEMEEVYGARFILLDDTRSYKNLDNARRLRADPSYRRIRHSHWVRNGWAVFEKIG